MAAKIASLKEQSQPRVEHEHLLTIRHFDPSGGFDSIRVFSGMLWRGNRRRELIDDIEHMVTVVTMFI